MSKTTIKSVTKLLTDCINTNKDELREFDEIVKALTPQDGKPINKRLKLPVGYSLEFRYGMTHLVNDKSERRHLIGYDSDNQIKIDSLERFDSCYSVGSRERIAKAEKILNDADLLKNVVSKYAEVEKHYTRLKELCNDLMSGNLSSFHNPVYYEILKSADIDTSILSDIHYGKR